MTTNLYSDLNAAVVSLLESVPDIGTVHNRQRWAADWRTLINLFQYEPETGDPSTIRGWMVSRSVITEEATESHFGTTGRIRTHTFVIRGIMAFSDENSSELVMNDLIDLILYHVIEDPAGVLAASATVFIPYSQTAIASAIDIRMFGSVLAHYVELNITLQTED